MLHNWQTRFSISFATFPACMQQSAERQRQLSNLLAQLDEKIYVDENIVSCLLEHLDFFNLVLSQAIILDGLHHAMTLFELSKLTYQPENIRLFCIVASVLANPLCQTIFTARLRGFSDYEHTSEPINPLFAKTIIQELSTINHEESRVRVFFNHFTTLRPFPPTQKYMVDIDIKYEVKTALTHHCLSKIEAITTRQDYVQTRQLIVNLQTGCSNNVLFNEIKYSVASSIEGNDFYSTRNYENLMEEIEPVLKSPLIHVSDFTLELESSKGYIRTASEAINASSPVFKRTKMNEIDADAVQSVNVVNRYD